jgi:hypothetical protein
MIASMLGMGQLQCHFAEVEQIQGSMILEASQQPARRTNYWFHFAPVPFQEPELDHGIATRGFKVGSTARS